MSSQRSDDGGDGVVTSSAPTLESLVAVLEEITGQTDLATDVRLADLGIDSMDILQWLFEIEEQLEVELEDLLEDESTELEAFGDVTLQELYTLLSGLVEQRAQGTGP